MKAWGAEMGQWKESEQMQQWRRDMEDWQKKVQIWAQDLAKRRINGEAAAPDSPKMPPMPPMPAMPKLPGPMKEELKILHERNETPYGDEESIYGDVKEDFGELFSEEMTLMDGRPQRLDPPEPPEPPAPPTVAGKQDYQIEAMSQKRQMIDLPPGTPLEVANQVGSMVVRGGDGPGCTIIATIKGSCPDLSWRLDDYSWLRVYAFLTFLATA